MNVAGLGSLFGRVILFADDPGNALLDSLRDFSRLLEDGFGKDLDHGEECRHLLVIV
jgi:hypothetical protein